MVNIERQGSPESWSKEELAHELHEGILTTILIKDGQEHQWWMDLFATKFGGQWSLHNADRFPLVINAVTHKNGIHTESNYLGWQGVYISRYELRNKATVVFSQAILPDSPTEEALRNPTVEMYIIDISGFNVKHSGLYTIDINETKADEMKQLSYKEQLLEGLK